MFGSIYESKFAWEESRFPWIFDDLSLPNGISFLDEGLTALKQVIDSSAVEKRLELLKAFPSLCEKVAMSPTDDNVSSTTQISNLSNPYATSIYDPTTDFSKAVSRGRYQNTIGIRFQ